MDNEVTSFIKKVRNLVNADKYEFVERCDESGRDYVRVLLEDFNITPDEAIKHIKSLNYHFYVPDMKPIYSEHNNAYVFKKQVNQVIAYIKLEIEKNNYGELVVIWSFHKDKN